MSTSNTQSSTQDDQEGWSDVTRDVYTATFDYWRVSGRPPTLRDVQARTERSLSVISYVWSGLARQGLLRFEHRGKLRRLAWMRGIETDVERAVRLLAEHKMLRVRVDRALAVVKNGEQPDAA